MFSSHLHPLPKGPFLREANTPRDEKGYLQRNNLKISRTIEKMNETSKTSAIKGFCHCPGTRGGGGVDVRGGRGDMCVCAKVVIIITYGCRTPVKLVVNCF